MTVDKFRFVSPGVQIDETDRSGIPQEVPAIGPAVVGRALMGPSMRPVRLETREDLYQILGRPSPGGGGGDVWREGNRAAPTYGLYAAEAYLRNNGPVTYVRLAGQEHPSADSSGLAGWDVQEAVGLYVGRAVSGSSGLDEVTASLGAVIYTTDASTDVRLMSNTHGKAATNTSGELVENESSDVSAVEYTVVIENYKGTSHLTATFNFNPDSEKYIRKVLNTNPHFTNDSIYAATSSALNYFLGETYESSLAEQLGSKSQGEGALTDMPGASDYAVIFRNTLSGGGAALDKRASEASVAKSGIVISQDLTQNTASFDPAESQKLFRFVATDIRGEWDNSNIKISIANIKAATNPTINPYGTFDVYIRSASDTDNTLSLLESHVGLNLNPASPDYIARRIGDRYLSWDSEEKYYEQYGTYKNVSKYIRMEMQDDVDNGTVNPSVLPFGYFGPIRTATKTATAAAGQATITEGMQFAAATITTGSSLFSGEAVAATFGVKVTGPSAVLRKSGSYGVSSPTKAFYGMQAQGTFARRDNGYGDYTTRMSSDLGSQAYGNGAATPATGAEYSFVFSLDDVGGTATAPVYAAGARVAGTSLRGVGSVDTLLNAQIDAFTMPMVGGTDGFDITEPEPFVNRLISGQSEQSSYELYSARKAIDTIRDPEVVEHNICTIPGLSDPLVTDYLVDMAEERRETLAIIDIENDYKPRFELLSSEIGTNRTVLPDVDAAVTSMKTRGFNTSYGASYYPATQIRDRGSNVVLYVPATVAAMAAIGYTDRVAEPWFAPAGFNRGGLSDGASGIVATGVSKKLSSKQRDRLYEVGVNPIAQFPQEGVVVYGQKTLQAVQSATDRVNVRRLLNYLKKEISKIANTVNFENNVKDTWKQFRLKAEPVLDDVKAKFGLEDYRLIMDETTTTPDLVDRNVLYGRVKIRPAKAIEFIAVDFEIFRSGASFDD